MEKRSFNPIKFVFEIGSWLLLAAFLGALFYTLASNSNLFGGYRSFMVQSGSMEPAIKIADIVIVKSSPVYYKGDVITFSDSDGRIVTHRVVASEEKDSQTYFITKGDANRSEDNDSITSEQIIGKVVFIVPRLGYFVSFGKSLPGFILLVIVPAGILVFDEVLKIVKNG